MPHGPDQSGTRSYVYTPVAAAAYCCHRSIPRRLSTLGACASKHSLDVPKTCAVHCRPAKPRPPIQHRRTRNQLNLQVVTQTSKSVSIFRDEARPLQALRFVCCTFQRPSPFSNAFIDSFVCSPVFSRRRVTLHRSPPNVRGRACAHRCVADLGPAPTEDGRWREMFLLSDACLLLGVDGLHGLQRRVHVVVPRVLLRLVVLFIDAVVVGVRCRCTYFFARSRREKRTAETWAVMRTSLSSQQQNTGFSATRRMEHDSCESLHAVHYAIGMTNFPPIRSSKHVSPKRRRLTDNKNELDK